MSNGLFNALGAYVIWGLLPLYLRSVNQASAIEIVSHRVIWSFVLAIIYLVAMGRIRQFIRQVTVDLVYTYSLAAALISVNWGVYVWGVNAGRTVEVSLGYFLMPIVSIILGALFIGERLSSVQYTGVAFAAAGAAYICLSADAFPWVALVLAASFGAYGLVKKKAPLAATEGLALETSILFVPALLILMILASRDSLTFLNYSQSLDLLLLAAGFVTLFPLILFAAASKLTSLSTLGMLQYVSPSLQFLSGVFVFQEQLSMNRLLGFVLVWLGLLVYTYGQFRREMAVRS